MDSTATVVSIFGFTYGLDFFEMPETDSTATIVSTFGFTYGFDIF